MKTVIFICCMVLTGCGLFQPIKQTNEPRVIEKPPPPAPTCNGRPLASTQIQRCPTGQSGNILEVCTQAGWQVVQNSCTIECDPDLANKTNFVGDVQPVLQQACVSCHSVFRGGRIDNFEIAKGAIQDIIYRVGLPASNSQRMPPPPGTLNDDQKALFSDWLQDGLLESSGCNPRDDTGSEWQLLDLDYLESNILDDLNRLDAQSRENVGYVTLSHKYNRWASEVEMKDYRNAINKSVNSLSTERDLLLTDPIDARQTIYRIDLESYGFGLDGPTDYRDDWEAASDGGDQFKFESFTNKGLLIKQLTGRDRVWMHADNYNLATHGDPDIYYEILDIPSDLFTFLNDNDIDIQQEFDNFDVRVFGTVESPITQNKNRLISRMENDDGYFWTTFDANSVFEEDKNYFEFPCLREMNCIKTANFDASEIIYTLPNGLQGYALFNANNVRENEAPIDVVQNVNSPFSPIIINGLDCHRCHNQALIVQRDAIRDSVIRNASEFDVDDVEKVKAFYPTNAGLSALFTKDINFFRQNLNKIGQDIGNADSINLLTDNFRKNQSLKEIAAFLFFSELELRNCINGDARLRSQIGQLITDSGNATITLAQFIVSFPDIVRGCRLGQDPIDR